MNPILEEIITTRRTILPSGELTSVDSDTDPECGALIQNAIKEIRPITAVEVGLAFGVSTLHILEAMTQSGGTKLIGMDPAQFDDHWCGGGLENIRRAGYEDLYEFHEQTSQILLPSLASKGLRIQFAFVDGWHTFDHTLVDFFYLDQMLEPGGVLVFDDVAYPAIRRVCDFVLTNRAYSIYGTVKIGSTHNVRRWTKLLLANALSPLTRTDKTPRPEALRKESLLGDVYFLALRKEGGDSRRWDHFAPF